MKELGRRTLAAIKTERDGCLADATYYWDILHSWSTLGSAAEAKSWLSATAKADPHRRVKVSRGILAYSLDGGRRQYCFRGLGSDRAFYDPKVLLAACEAFATTPNLDENEAARIMALRSGLRSARDDEQAEGKAEAGAPGQKTARRLKVRAKPVQA